MGDVSEGMRKLPLVMLVAICIAVALTAMSCSDSPVKPSPTPTPGTPVVVGIEIVGPATVAPSSTVQLNALLKLEDGTSKLATTEPVQWFASTNPVLLQVNSRGLVSASPLRGEARVTVRYGSGSQTVTASREIVVVPDGTFRLSGLVRDSESLSSLLDSARVEVPSEPGLSTMTNSTGEYKLYGVPPNAVIQVSRQGYAPIAQPVQLTGHALRDFVMVLDAARLELFGQYTVAMDMPASCSYGTGLVPELRRRVYEATVTQSGPAVEVTLTEPRFRLNHANRGNRFTGFANSTGVRFTLDAFDSYYYLPAYPSVAEQLSDGTFFVPQGEAIVTGNSSRVSGGFNATFAHYDKSFASNRFALLSHCTTPLTQLTLTRR